MNFNKVLKTLKKNWPLVLVAVIVLYVVYDNCEGFTDGASAGGKKTVVMFYAPWCPHCQTLEPVWDKLTKKHANNTTVVLKKVNCDEQPKEAEKHGVAGFPTILMFRDGKKVATFDLPQRTEDNIEKFIATN